MSPASATSSRASSCERNTEKYVHEKYNPDSSHYGNAKESWKPAAKHAGGSNGSLNASNAYNPLSATFHHLDARAPESAGNKTNPKFKSFDDTDEGHRFSSDFDSVSNNGSCSGDSEDQHASKDRTNASVSLPAGASSLDKREKIRLKNEKKHLRQKQRKAQELRDKCISYLTARKLESLSEQLESMGFSKDRATMALICNDGHLERSVAWLLEAGEEEFKEDFIGSGSLKLDISNELAQMSELERRFGLGKSEVERAVVSCEGDLSRATNLLREKRPSVPAPTESASLATSPSSTEPPRMSTSLTPQAFKPSGPFSSPDSAAIGVFGPGSSADFPTLQSASKGIKQNASSLQNSRANAVPSSNRAGYPKSTHGATDKQKQSGYTLHNSLKDPQRVQPSSPVQSGISFTSESPLRLGDHAQPSLSGSASLLPVRPSIPVSTDRSSPAVSKAWKPISPVPLNSSPTPQAWGKTLNPLSIAPSSSPAGSSMSQQSSNVLESKSSSKTVSPKSTQSPSPWSNSSAPNPKQSQLNPNVHSISASSNQTSLSEKPSNLGFPDDCQSNTPHRAANAEKPAQSVHQPNSGMGENFPRTNEIQLGGDEVGSFAPSQSFVLHSIPSPLPPSSHSSEPTFSWDSELASLNWSGNPSLGSGLINSVDWSTGGSDQSSLGGSVNLWGFNFSSEPSTIRAGAWDTPSNRMDENGTAADAVDKSAMWGNYLPWNHLNSSLNSNTGNSNGGESSDSGMQMWTSPFAGRSLFSLPHQAALPTL